MPSSNPQIRAIEIEANRLAGLDGKSSMKERFALRNQLRAEAGLPPEKKTRGGVAGVVDRNRNFVGNLVKNVAPALALIPGVGIPAAAAVGAAGRAIQKGANIGDIARQGASTAATAAAAQGALGAIKRVLPSGTPAGGELKPLPAPGERGASTLPGLPGGTPTATDGASGPWWQNPEMLGAVTGAAGQAPGASASGGGFWDAAKDVAGKVAGAVTGGRGADGLLDAGLLGLAGAQAVNAANASARARGLSDDAIDLAKENWAAGEGLRTAGRDGMLNPVRRDLSSVYADPTNPFAERPATAPVDPTRLTPMPRPIPRADDPMRTARPRGAPETAPVAQLPGGILPSSADQFTGDGAASLPAGTLAKTRRAFR
jgi:hypothetical protein